jgi:hypothetical protein
MPGDLWSQFWFQLFSFMVIRERSRDHFASVKDDLRNSLDFGLRIWKAGWVQALAGSNPASSADCGLGGEPVCEHGVVAHLVEHATTLSNLTGVAISARRLPIELESGSPARTPGSCRLRTVARSADDSRPSRPAR